MSSVNIHVNIIENKYYKNKPPGNWTTILPSRLYIQVWRSPKTRAVTSANPYKQYCHILHFNCLISSYLQDYRFILAYFGPWKELHLLVAFLLLYIMQFLLKYK